VNGLCFKSFIPVSKEILPEEIIQAYDFFDASVKRFSKITSSLISEPLTARCSDFVKALEQILQENFRGLALTALGDTSVSLILLHGFNTTQAIIAGRPIGNGRVAFLRTDTEQAGGDAKPTYSQVAKPMSLFRVSPRTDEAARTHL
jgi:hypothetical protein